MQIKWVKVLLIRMQPNFKSDYYYSLKMYSLLLLWLLVRFCFSRWTPSFLMAFLWLFLLLLVWECLLFTRWSLFFTLKVSIVEESSMRSVHKLLLHNYQLLSGHRRTYIVIIWRDIVAIASKHYNTIIARPLGVTVKAFKWNHSASHMSWSSSSFKLVIIIIILGILLWINVHKCYHSIKVFRNLRHIYILLYFKYVVFFHLRNLGLKVLFSLPKWFFSLVCLGLVLFVIERCERLSSGLTIIFRMLLWLIFSLLILFELLSMRLVTFWGYIILLLLCSLCL